MASRRNFLKRWTQVAAGALAGAITVSTSEAHSQQLQTGKKKLHILMRSSWGTDEPTRASFVFSHGLALADAGHDVQIFLTHDATYLMRKATVDAVKPIGWPALSETMAKSCSQAHPGIFLRSLLPGPWGHGGGLEQLERAMGHSSDLCIPRGMG